ncbi:Uncharacterised protein [Mycobacteroides abscessus subsp. abscessus]|nr:Uncharacterised protein [Mycobacteroides abscessus subsp. abscessus]
MGNKGIQPLIVAARNPLGGLYVGARGIDRVQIAAKLCENFGGDKRTEFGEQLLATRCPREHSGEHRQCEQQYTEHNEHEERPPGSRRRARLGDHGPLTHDGGIRGQSRRRVGWLRCGPAREGLSAHG